MQDRFSGSLFVRYSPSDDDFFLQPMFNYRLDDSWLLSTGANLFGGEDEHTEFGQLENSSNTYFRLRYSY